MEEDHKWDKEKLKKNRKLRHETEKLTKQLFEILDLDELSTFYIWKEEEHEYTEIPPGTLHCSTNDDQLDETYDWDQNIQHQKHSELVYRKFLIQQASVIQRFNNFKSKSESSWGPVEIHPGTLHSSWSWTHSWLWTHSWWEMPSWWRISLRSWSKYRNYCLFNLESWKDNDGFCLNDFLDKIDEISNYKPNSLINVLLSQYCNNFVEFEEFYRDKIKQSLIDTSLIDFWKVHVLKGENINLYDIRCWLAHNVSFYKDKKWKWLVHIEREKDNGVKIIADIEPSFFDDVLKLPSTCKDLECDVLTLWKWKRINLAKHRYNSKNRPLDFMENDDRFSGVLSTAFNQNYLYKKKEIKEMCDKITSSDFLVSWPTLWLASKVNRPYVHNLFSIICITLFYQIIKNPNIAYKEIERKTTEEISNNIFTIDNKEYIIKFCIENIESRLKLQCLKTYYINIYKKVNEKRTNKWNKKPNGKQRRNAHEERMTHIRNALTHWRYTIIWNNINMRDEGRTNGVQPTKADDEYCSTNIDELYNEVLWQELAYEKSRDGSMVKCIAETGEHISSILNW